MVSRILVSASWRDYFVMVGGAAAALTGLVFVAMSLNLHEIVSDLTHRYRAIGTLVGLVSAFTISALALVAPRNHVWLGVEWAAVSVPAGAMYLYGYIGARRSGGSTVGMGRSRILGSMVCFVVEEVGAVLLAAGHLVGLDVAAVALVLYFSFLVSGAWFLIVGVHESVARAEGAGTD